MEDEISLATTKFKICATHDTNNGVYHCARCHMTAPADLKRPMKKKRVFL